MKTTATKTKQNRKRKRSTVRTDCVCVFVKATMCSMNTVHLSISSLVQSSHGLYEFIVCRFYIESNNIIRKIPFLLFCL